MKINPMSDYVLCKKLTRDTSTANVNGFVYDLQNIPEYVVIDIPLQTKNNKKVFVGDVVMTNSIPTKFNTDDDEFFLIKESNIIGVIEKV